MMYGCQSWWYLREGSRTQNKYDDDISGWSNVEQSDTGKKRMENVGEGLCRLANRCRKDNQATNINLNCLFSLRVQYYYI